MATTQTLLSRITYAMDIIESVQTMPVSTLKRNATDEEEARSTKRRALAEEHFPVEEGPGFAPWLDHDDSYTPDASREELLHHEIISFVDYISPSKHGITLASFLGSR